MNKEYLQTKYNEFGNIKKFATAIGYSPEGARKLLLKNNIEYNKKLRYNYKKNSFSVVSEHSFYWAGFIAADGNVSNHGDFSFGLQKQDEKSVFKLREFLGSNCKIIYRKNFTQIRFRAREIVDDLCINFGIVPNKSLIYKIPQNIIDNDNFKHFIRGYFDGDGSFSIINNRSRWGFAGTRSTCMDISSYLHNNLHLSSQGSIVCRGNYYVLTFYRQFDVYKICSYLYDNSTICLDRKKNICLQSKRTLDDTNIFSISKDELQCLYNKYKSRRLVAKNIGCSTSVVGKYINLYDIRIV